jgi:DHA2 family metal-tetracycline-proton antiporter-like MFS transporter
MSENMIINPSRQRLILVNVAFTSFIVALDTYIVNVSLPSIAHYFNLGTSNVVYVMVAYLLVIASTLPLFGKLGDKFGFKRFFILGFFFFTLGSLLCGISPGIGILIGARCLQGIGGAMLYAIGTAMIPRYLPESRRGLAFGITSTSAGLGMALGAPVGGFITEFFSWQWIFLVNVPVGIASLIIAWRVIPRDEVIDKKKGENPPFDITGAVLSFLGLLTLVYALNRGQETGWTSPLIISLFIISVILLTSFFMWEKRCRDPVLDLALFKITAFRYAALAGLAAFALYAGSNFMMPFYLIHIKDLSMSRVGLIIMIYSVVYMIVSPVMGRLSDRINPIILSSAGMASAIAACAFFAFGLRLPGLVPTIAFIIWLGLSYASFISPNNNRVMGAAPQDRQGIASGVYRTMQMIGMVIGVSVLETIFSLHIPRTALDTSLSQTSVPQNILLNGFNSAYLVGSVICALGLAFSLLARKKAVMNTDAGD